MGSLLMNIALCLILTIMQDGSVSAQPCSSKTTVSADDRFQATQSDCDDNIPTSRQPADGDDSGGVTSDAMYTILVVSGVILIPLIVLVRICWLRKLQKQRDCAINEVRRIVDQRLQEEHRRANCVFTIDIGNIPAHRFYMKPPSYEECLSDPDMGYPPPYDAPPEYSRQKVDTDGQPVQETADQDTQEEHTDGQRVEQSVDVV